MDVLHTLLDKTTVERENAQGNIILPQAAEILHARDELSSANATGTIIARRAKGANE